MSCSALCSCVVLSLSLSLSLTHSISLSLSLSLPLSLPLSRSRFSRLISFGRIGYHSWIAGTRCEPRPLCYHLATLSARQPLAPYTRVDLARGITLLYSLTPQVITDGEGQGASVKDGTFPHRRRGCKNSQCAQSFASKGLRALENRKRQKTLFSSGSERTCSSCARE